MKKVIFALALIPSLLFAQQKHDNTIIIKGVSFDMAVKSLADQGFFFANKDNETGTAITLPQLFPKPYVWHGVAKMTVFIHVKDSVLYLTGKFDLENLYHQEPVSLFGMNRSLAQQSFLYMDSIAKGIKPDVEYAKL